MLIIVKGKIKLYITNQQRGCNKISILLHPLKVCLNRADGGRCGYGWLRGAYIICDPNIIPKAT